MNRILVITGAAIAFAGLVTTAGWREKPRTESQTFVAGPTATAVFSGGCFWGLQAAFDELPGVVGTRAGYTGGTTSSPTYERVVAGGTGHAEAVEVVFDPSRVSYEELVRYFFKHHRSTSDELKANYQTRSYRSEIFVSNPDQREIAERVRAGIAAQTKGDKPVVTLIGDATRFWEAEAYHQKYLAQCSH